MSPQMALRPRGLGPWELPELTEVSEQRSGNPCEAAGWSRLVGGCK